MDIRALAMRLARTRIGGTVAWVVLGPIRRASPLRVLVENEEMRAFGHPRPAYATHVLIVPKRRLADFPQVTPGLLRSVLDLAAQLSREEQLELVSNLGANQEVKLLHFHLISATELEAQGRVDRDDVASLLTSTTASATRALTKNGAVASSSPRE